MEAYDTKKPNSLEIVIGDESRGREERRLTLLYVPVGNKATTQWEVPSIPGQRVHGDNWNLSAVIPAIPAFVDLDQNVGGRWRSMMVHAQDDEIFCVQAYQRMASGNAVTANVLIRTRKNGPLQTISLPTAQLQTSTRKEAYVRGTFDIIPVSTAVRMGAKVSDLVVGRLMQDAFKLCPSLQLKVVRAELESLPQLDSKTVVDDAGQELQVYKQRRRRLVSGLEKI